MRSWTAFVIGLVVGAAGLFGAVACYFLLGVAPVAVSATPMPFESAWANAALRHARGTAAGVKPPIEPTEANLLAGARNYRSACAICHSLPGLGKTDIGKSMFPPPPLLLTGKGVTDDPVGETDWVVKNGIRMTGMPAFEHEFSDDELWQISLLLQHANSLPQSVQDLLKQPDSVPVEAAKGEPNQSTAERDR